MTDTEQTIAAMLDELDRQLGEPLDPDELRRAVARLVAIVRRMQADQWTAADVAAVTGVQVKGLFLVDGDA